MTKENQDFDLWSGDDATLTIAVTDENDAIVNLTGATALAWILKRSEHASAILVTKGLGTGVTVTNALGGIFTVDLDAADTDILTKGDYYHEAQIIDVGGKKSTLLIGIVAIKHDAIV